MQTKASDNTNESEKTNEEKVQEFQEGVESAHSFIDWLKEMWLWFKGLFGK